MSGVFKRLFRWPWRTRDQIRADLEEEFALHADLRCDELIARGVPVEEARATAAREFDNMTDARRARRLKVRSMRRGYFPHPSV